MAASVQTHARTWWSALVRPEQAGRLVLGLEVSPGFDRFVILLLCLAYFLYGFGMGLFRGFFPALISGLKLPFLYLLTLAVCVPLLYVLNCAIGPRLGARHCLRLLLLSMSANAIALASYAPVNYFFTLTTSRQGYSFLILTHVAAFGLAGLASLVVIGLIFRATAEELERPLRSGFLLAWGVLYGFVGTQMSWVLRPWIGTWAAEYQPFRPLGGTFIEAVWQLLTKP